MTLAKSLLATLTYSDHFAFPLTIDELHSRLIGNRATKPRIMTELTNLVADQKVDRKGRYFFLPGRASLIVQRTLRAKAASSQRARAKALASKLVRVPGVVAIYLTGSLAMDNADKNADIDVMVITEADKLWTTRLLLTLYTELSGLRRRPNTTSAGGKLCLNLYLTPDSYALPESKRNLYTAYELIQAVPLVGSEGTRAELLAGNPWIHEFLPNVTFPQRKQKSVANIRSKKNLLENLAYRLQLAYMRHKITREYVTPDAAFFHPHNPGDAVLSKITR